MQFYVNIFVNHYHSFLYPKRTDCLQIICHYFLNYCNTGQWNEQPAAICIWTSMKIQHQGTGSAKNEDFQHLDI